MKKFKSILLSVVLVLAVCVGLIACNSSAPTKYTLSFDMGGHGTQIEAQQLTNSELPDFPSTPKAEGWKFLGWYVDADYTEEFYFDEPITKNTTVYVRWKKLKVVEFNTGIDGFTVANQYVDTNGTISLPVDTMVADGKKFEGWYIDPNYTSAFTGSTPVTNDVTLYAKWSTYYEVKFDNNGVGAANRVPQTQTYTVDGSVAQKPADMSANSYKFLGWSLDKDGARGLYNFGEELTGSITLYAQWVRIHTVEFDLNNEDILIAPPANQSVEEGSCVVKPEDLVVPGFEFCGWYTDAACTEEFDFSSQIYQRTTLYVKWIDNTIGSIDSSDLPNYEWDKEAAYGERPDLDGYLIDGFMGEDEHWEEQVWYEHGFTEAPTVSYKISTQFSDKGLYIFIQATDNGGIAFTGRGYHYKNTGMQLSIINGDKGSSASIYDYKTFNFDTYNARGSYNTYKLAIQVVEGTVNPIGDNKKGVWNAEIFYTWDSLGFGYKPESVRILPWYYYKRIQSATSTYTLLPTFVSSTGQAYAPHFPEFNGDGYMLGDVENAILGNSSYGIAKTNGWDISHVNDDENAYVESIYGNVNCPQVLFYKNISGNYYEFETDIEVSNISAINGVAGLMIYNSPLLYTMMTFDVNSKKYTSDGFLSVKPKFSLTNKDGNVVSTLLSEITFDQPIKKINLKAIFSNGYVYYMLNGKLFYCQFLSTINERTTPALYTDTVGVKFSSYKATVLTAAEAYERSSQYAYVVSAAKTQRIDMEFDVIGVDKSNPTPITMTVIHENTTLTSTVKNAVLSNDFSQVRMYEIDTFYKTVLGKETEDITDEILSPENGISYGKYVIKNLDGDTSFGNTARLISTDNLVYLTAKVINGQTEGAVSGSPVANIKSNNPRLSNYRMGITGGVMVLVLQKGFDYEISISVEGFRTYTLDKIFNVTESADLGTIALTPTVVGGAATSDDKKYSVMSTNSCFDYSQETDGIVTYLSDRPNSSVAYFSGYTMDKYQVAEVKIANMTETDLVSVYEKDPACGFVIDNLATNLSYFIGLHQKGLRFLQRGVAWNPTHYHTYGKDTVNKATVDGSYYNTLTMVKISNGGLMMLYMFIDGQFITSIDVTQMGGDTAIGFTVTTSYYIKIKFFDYWIKTGDEAVEYAKQLVGCQFELDDSAYDIDDYGDPDYSKPLISVSDLNPISKDDGSVEDIAFVGSSVKVELNTEYAYDGYCYLVHIGNDVLVLSMSNPVVDYYIPTSLTGNIDVSVSMANSATVSGKFVYENGKPAGVVSGEIVADSGETVSFTSGADGTFTAYVIKGKVYTVKTQVKNYINISSSIVVNTEFKDFGNIVMIPVVVGGSSSEFVSNSQAIYGYNYYDTKGNEIEGLYSEIYHLSDDYQVYRGGAVGDFVLDFSFFRTQVDGFENEKDPAVGIFFTSGTLSEFYGFWRTGSLVLVNNSWTGNHNVQNVLSSSLQSYDTQFDFRIVRLGSTFIFYGKTEDETEYRYVDTYAADKDFGRSEFRFRLTAAAYSHHFWYNVNLTPLNSSNIPDYIKRDVNITNDSSMGSVKVLGSSLSEADKYVVGDKLRIVVSPVNGKALAYAIANGKMLLASDNTISYTVNYGANDIQLVYEDEPTLRSVTGKIVPREGDSLPTSAKVYVCLEDGREFAYDVNLDDEGNFEIEARHGKLVFCAEVGNFYSSPVTCVVSETTTDIGTLDLGVYKAGNVVVNGNTMNADLSYVFDKTLGEYRAPGRSGGTAYMPELVASGDFVFSCDVTLNTGDPTSKYYSPDFSTGFEFTNGKTNVEQKTFGILFTCDGFRVSHGGWSSTYMVETHNGLSYYYPRNKSEDVTHNFKLVRLGTTLKVYVDDELSMTINPTDGVKMYVNGNVVNNSHTGPGNLTDCETWIKNQVNTMFGENGGDIAIGYKVNINTATAGVLNSAGFRNTSLVTDPDIIEQYK